MNSPAVLNSTLTPNTSKSKLNTNSPLDSWMKNTQFRFKLGFYTFTRKSAANKPPNTMLQLSQTKAQQRKEAEPQKQVPQSSWGSTITPLKQVTIKEEIFKANLATEEKEISNDSEYLPNTKYKRKKKKVVKKIKAKCYKKQRNLGRKLF